MLCFFRQIKGEKFLNIQQSRSFDVKIPCNQAWQSDQRIRRKLGDQILKSFLKITANMIAKGLIKLENQTSKIKSEVQNIINIARFFKMTI